MSCSRYIFAMCYVHSPVDFGYGDKHLAKDCIHTYSISCALDLPCSRIPPHLSESTHTSLAGIPTRNIHNPLHIPNHPPPQTLQHGFALRKGCSGPSGLDGVCASDLGGYLGGGEEGDCLDVVLPFSSCTVFLVYLQGNERAGGGDVQLWKGRSTSSAAEHQMRRCLEVREMGRVCERGGPGWGRLCPSSSGLLPVRVRSLSWAIAEHSGYSSPSWRPERSGSTKARQLTLGVTHSTSFTSSLFSTPYNSTTGNASAQMSTSG